MGRKKRSIYGAKFANRAKYSALRNQVATEPIAEDVPEPTLPTLVEEQLIVLVEEKPVAVVEEKPVAVVEEKPKPKKKNEQTNNDKPTKRDK